jgi:Tfp pilus assembly protein FimT
MSNHHERGATLIDLVTVLAISGVMVVAAIGYSLPWMASQTLRSDQHMLAGFLQLAKIEAVSRNRPCRFVIDTATGVVEVRDGMGTTATTDDTLLHQATLSPAVTFQRPDVGNVVTFAAHGFTGTYHVVFDSRGTVDTGTGDLFLSGGDAYGRISAHAAGGIELSRWDGNSWESGS